MTHAGPQPRGTELRVCVDIALRQAHGLAKYGTSVEANPLTLRQWLQHAYEEALDQAIYLKRAMEEMDQKPDYLYKVVDGDTLSQIAARFELHVYQLAIWNKIDNPDILFPGQLLHLKQP
jgi:hypothetical protein